MSTSLQHRIPPNMSVEEDIDPVNLFLNHDNSTILNLLKTWNSNILLSNSETPLKPTSFT